MPGAPAEPASDTWAGTANPTLSIWGGSDSTYNGMCVWERADPGSSTGKRSERGWGGSRAEAEEWELGREEER